MNLYENQMLTILKDLKNHYGAVAVRAEFETEGTKLEESLRLKEVCARAGLRFTVKIGGCESIRDMLEARVVGVSSLAAPMIESAFALTKFSQAVRKVFSKDELSQMNVLANIETKMGMQRLDQILASPEVQHIESFIIERVDLCFSLGMDADSINSAPICDMVQGALTRIKEAGRRTTIGGGVSADSLPFFTSLKPGVLDYFETRKVTFDAQRAMATDPKKAIISALAFELFYLKNKMNFFGNVSVADQKRLAVIEARYWNQMNL